MLGSSCYVRNRNKNICRALSEIYPGGVERAGGLAAREMI